MRLILITFFTAITFLLFSQAGMTVYLGPSMAFSSDKIVTGSGEGHYGYVVGAHARLNSDAMYFLISGEYGAMDFISNKKFAFIGGDDLTYAKGKIGLGFDVIRISSKFAIRTKIQGSLMFVNKYPEDLLKNTLKYKDNSYISINDGIAGLATCAGVTLGILTFDLEYEHGLFNLFKDKKSSKINFLSLTTGVKF